MSLSDLSDSAQNILKTIWSLSEWSAEEVTTTAVAARMGVRAPTVSEGLRKLRDRGLVDHAPYGQISLTPRGSDYAVAMVRRHRLMETFLVEVLGYTWDEVHDEAENLEHAVSDLLVDRVDALLGHPTRDPHGDPIPDAAGRVTAVEAVPLTELEPGASAVVTRISDADPGLLQFLRQRDIGIGTQVTVLAPEPYADAVRLDADEGEPTSFGRSHAAQLWVSVTEP